MKYYFIVAAAGVGKRMNMNIPKQFLEIDGKPIIAITLEKINRSSLVTDIIVVSSDDYLDKTKKIVEAYGIDKVNRIVVGGKERQDSIYNALQQIVETNSIVAIQDGVRPFIEQSYISEPYSMLQEGQFDGVVVGVKAKDTVKILNEKDEIIDTPDRKSMILAQTPQVFKTKVLLEAYNKAYRDGFYGTDDSSIVERYGGRVRFIEGSYENIKITTSEDLITMKK